MPGAYCSFRPSPPPTPTIRKPPPFSPPPVLCGLFASPPSSPLPGSQAGGGGGASRAERRPPQHARTQFCSPANFLDTKSLYSLPHQTYRYHHLLTFLAVGPNYVPALSVNVLDLFFLDLFVGRPARVQLRASGAQRNLNCWHLCLSRHALIPCHRHLEYVRKGTFNNIRIAAFEIRPHSSEASRVKDACQVLICRWRG